MFPKLTWETYSEKKNDMTWLYSEQKVCDICYKYIWEITDEMTYREEHEIPKGKIGWLIPNPVKEEKSLKENSISLDSFEEFRKRLENLNKRDTDIKNFKPIRKQSTKKFGFSPMRSHRGSSQAGSVTSNKFEQVP